MIARADPGDAWRIVRGVFVPTPAHLLHLLSQRAGRGKAAVILSGASMDREVAAKVRAGT